MKTCLAFILLILTILPAVAQVYPFPATRIRRGTGAPTSGNCDSAGEVGQVYVRQDAAATGSTFYVCANTAAMTYAWELAGTGGGSGTVSTGAAKCMAFYPSAGTTVNDTQNSMNCALEFDATENTLTGFDTSGVAQWVLDGDTGSFTGGAGATRFDMTCGAAPSTPSSGHVVEYCTSDVPLFKDDNGAVLVPVVAATCTAPAVVTAVSASGVITCTNPVITQNSQSAAYTTVLGDAGKHILHPSSDNNARTFTIAANASVAYPVGTCITFINQINTVTIAINSDTLTLMGAGTTGSRTLAANNIATACKVASTSWVISGSSGLT